MPDTTAHPIEVTPCLPDPALPGADWADAFEIETHQSFGDMKSLAERTVGSMPAWAKGLLRCRNLLVTPFGLKPDGIQDAKGKANRVDIFPILEEAAHRIVLGLDDRHLDFRIVVERRTEAHKARLRATTLVQRHNAFGRLYITLITPFHRLIVQSVLKNAL